MRAFDDTDPGGSQPSRTRHHRDCRALPGRFGRAGGVRLCLAADLAAPVSRAGQRAAAQAGSVPVAGPAAHQGMFAIRTPWRINPIGLSLIQLLEVTGQTIRFAGVDLLDGTTVIDLKPYVAR